MLSESKIKKLCEVFQTLEVLDRQLIALKIMCFQFSDEKLFIATLRKSSINGGFTDERYQAFLNRLIQLGFTKKGLSAIPQELHHPLLVLMKEGDMIWVYGIVKELYGDVCPEIHEGGYHHRERKLRARAHLVMAMYDNNPDYFLAYEDSLNDNNKLLLDIYDVLSEHPVNLAWLESRNIVIRSFICIALLSHYFCDKQPVVGSADILDLLCRNKNTHHDFLEYYSGLIQLAIGNIEAATTCCLRISSHNSGFALALQATVAFWDAHFDLASKLYRKSLAAIRKQSGIRHYYFDNILGVFHAFCVAYVDKNYAQLASNANYYTKYAIASWVMPMYGVYSIFSIVSLLERANQQVAIDELQALQNTFTNITNPFLIALYQLFSYMVNKDSLQADERERSILLHISLESKHVFAVHLFYELLHEADPCDLEACAYFDNSPIRLRLLDFIHLKENWEYSFQALENLLTGAALELQNKRLLWLVDPNRYDIDVVEQRLGKSGQWSHGRAISLAKLKHHHMEPALDYLCAHDKRVISTITEERDGWRGSYYAFSFYPTILALIGHPNVAHYENRDVSIELVQCEPELHIEENSAGYHVSLSHYLAQAGLIIEPESLNKYRVIDFSQAFVNIGRVLTNRGLSIPAVAKDKVLSVIQHAKRDIKIHVGMSDIAIPEISGNPSPCLQILPVKEGVRLTLLVKPDANQGVYFKAGDGKDVFMILVTTELGNDVRTRVVRDLLAEKEHQQTLLSQCPSLLMHEVEPGEYVIDTPENVLEVLSELQQYAYTYPVTIEWPQGQSFKIKQRVNAKNLSLNIKSNNNWFEYDGRLALDNGEVLDMQELLQSLDSNALGRFIRLREGEFIELTSQLKRQLNVLHALSSDQKINALGAQILSDIVADVEHTTFDAGWAAHLKKIKTMRNHTPKVPETLQAHLRDYQIEGFQYLSRLTHWGMGACLADDMGLGKTIQTIALLLARAKLGPALVIAPTSVCFNWIDELIKFAPTLTIHDLRTQDRAKLISKAGKFDVVICSYGLLQHNDELLADKSWETIVLDEAQAIKNAQTQRWKTVMKLKGKSRIALSGTPIENHLGELWSIFSFINPGLLGSIKSFQTKYATPIETKQSPDTIHALRSLVQPYILRRIKSDVLRELPPKIEQIIHVEQSEAEATFYEALRRTAAERMAHFMSENNRISVLAEITKLRQACCDSSLVDSTVCIENSKLKLFIEMVKNIIDNGHKVLVFSQYVSFLKIVRARIEHAQIAYQYLDGSTSAMLRKKSVDAFQSGDGDVFLLSLKAGGSGLNLTAADYVIHLDPWWNPAVEDQASDRAHRIGQERPVTIYRLVMQNTIEEKMISLHEHKRNLATELLSGHGVGSKLSNDDLMNLISMSYGVI